MLLLCVRPWRIPHSTHVLHSRHFVHGPSTSERSSAARRGHDAAAAACSGRVEVLEGDASRLASSHGGAAGIVSCFGLQQMPHPDRVLADWVSALAPGGGLKL